MKKLALVFIIISSMVSADVFTPVCSGLKATKGVSKVDNANLFAKFSTLSQVTQKSLSLSKIDNIQDLMEFAVKESRVEFKDQCSYIQIFKKLENGDSLLLKCLKNSECNLEEYSNLMSKSPLHIQQVIKYPNLSLAQINHRVGSINENLMNKYFQSAGWTKIKGEVGRNGIDGLFIKRKNGVIIDVLIVESKYNKSGLQHTNHGQQMTKQWITKKIEDLQKIPNNPYKKDYDTIQRFVENDSYRAMLWNLKTTDKDLIISLKKIHDKGGKAVTSDLKGGEKMKMNFNGNQNINIEDPQNDFHKQIVTWYKEEIKQGG